MIHIHNVANEFLKVRTCGADYCAGSGHTTLHYVDCAQKIMPDSNANIVIANDVKYMVFQLSHNTTDMECWPAPGGPFASDITVPLSGPRACQQG